MASEALAWLSGDEIDPEIARSFGLKTEGSTPAMIGDDQEAEQVLRALARLALESHQPLILCVDQVDNLDPEKLKSLVRFLHALLDHASNLLVITSGVKQTLLAYRDDGVIAESTWDRIAEYMVEVNRISPADARKILEARLERFHEPFIELKDVRRRLHEDTLFPLGRDWLSDRLGDGVEFRPRDILSWARDAWEDDAGEGRRRRRRRLDQEMATRSEQRREAMESRSMSKNSSMRPSIARSRSRSRSTGCTRGAFPRTPGNLAGLVESLLGQCVGDGLPYTFRGVERPKKKAGKLPPYDLLVRERRDPDGREVKTGVSFVTNVGLSATAALRRLLEGDASLDHRILVTDQERRPLKVGRKAPSTTAAWRSSGPASSSTSSSTSSSMPDSTPCKASSAWPGRATWRSRPREGRFARSRTPRSSPRIIAGTASASIPCSVRC